MQQSLITNLFYYQYSYLKATEISLIFQKAFLSRFVTARRAIARRGSLRDCHAHCVYADLKVRATFPPFVKRGIQGDFTWRTKSPIAPFVKGGEKDLFFCHFDPFLSFRPLRFTQGKLREKSLSRAKGGILRISRCPFACIRE